MRSFLFRGFTISSARLSPGFALAGGLVVLALGALACGKSSGGGGGGDGGSGAPVVAGTRLPEPRVTPTVVPSPDRSTGDPTLDASGNVVPALALRRFGGVTRNLQVRVVGKRSPAEDCAFLHEKSLVELGKASPNAALHAAVAGYRLRVEERPGDELSVVVEGNAAGFVFPVAGATVPRARLATVETQIFHQASFLLALDAACASEFVHPARDLEIEGWTTPATLGSDRAWTPAPRATSPSFADVSVFYASSGSTARLSVDLRPRDGTLPGNADRARLTAALYDDARRVPVTAFGPVTPEDDGSLRVTWEDRDARRALAVLPRLRVVYDLSAAVPADESGVRLWGPLRYFDVGALCRSVAGTDRHDAFFFPGLAAAGTSCLDAPKLP